MNHASAPPFRRIGVVGLGLIGGSIALGLRRRWPSLEVIGVDDAAVVETARGLDAITGARARLEDLSDAELVVLAAPVLQIASLLEAAARAGLRGTITDVGSTKRHIMTAARGVKFVGGHPIAGAALRGIAYARPDLFERREWLVVPGTGGEAAVEQVEALALGLGARPRRLDAESHDRLMAYVSHLPQILATALMTTAANAVGEDGLRAAGPGFADMTRLASSSGELWSGILATNADFIAEAAEALVATLPGSPGAFEDTARIDALFRAANRWAART